MKKATIFLAVIVLISAVGAEAYAEEGTGLPSISEVLQGAYTAERIKVRDDLSEYNPENMEAFDLGGFRCIVLERRFPEKEFTEFDSGYPDNYVEDFPDDFTGVDVGEPTVWLRGDIMSRLPEACRAKSLEEADFILIAENEYIWAGTLIVSDFKYGDDDRLPEFDTIEEMEEYLQSHQPVITKITYYPKFASYTLLDIYDPITKVCQPYDYTYTEAKTFASNPEACYQWSDMKDLQTVITALSAGGTYESLIKDVLADFDFVPQDKLDFWNTCIDAGEYSSAAASVNEYYWGMAEQLCEMDSSEDHAKNYHMVIDAQDADALAMLVDFCNYGGFDTPIEEIRASKEYIAEPDLSWLEEALDGFVQMLN